jgi:RNA polymerase subunit RPABC4/transcription elongation factor Spt4
MKCPRCQHETPSDAEFCPECGARLGGICAGCGTENALGHKFCKKCQSLTSSGPGPTRGPDAQSSDFHRGRP